MPATEAAQGRLGQFRNNSYLRLWMLADSWRTMGLHITPRETAVALQSRCLLIHTTEVMFLKWVTPNS